MFRVSRNFLRISRNFRPNFNFVFRKNFVKLKENFAKYEVDNFAKCSRKQENENFRSHPMCAAFPGLPAKNVPVDNKLWYSHCHWLYASWLTNQIPALIALPYLKCEWPDGEVQNAGMSIEGMIMVKSVGQLKIQVLRIPGDIIYLTLIRILPRSNTFK